MLWLGRIPPVPRLLLETGMNEKNCTHVMTGGAAARTTVSPPNWDEWKALYTCYRAYKSGGPIPSTTGGGKVKAGSRTGCSSTRRGSPRGLPTALALTCAILGSRVTEKKAMEINLARSRKAFEFLLWASWPFDIKLCWKKINITLWNNSN